MAALLMRPPVEPDAGEAELVSCLGLVCGPDAALGSLIVAACGASCRRWTPVAVPTAGPGWPTSVGR